VLAQLIAALMLAVVFESAVPVAAVARPHQRSDSGELTPSGLTVAEARMFPPSHVNPSAVRGRFRAAALGQQDPNADVMVYEGNESSPENGGNASYTALEAAVGRTVDVETSLPESAAAEEAFTHHACVLLQLNAQPFSSQQVDSLRNYMEQGGVVVAVAEYHEYDPDANETFNGLAASLGVNMSFQDNSLNGGFRTTSLIGSSPFAEGVSSLEYAAVAGLNVASPAQSIASVQVEEEFEEGEEGLEEGGEGGEGGEEMLARRSARARRLARRAHPADVGGVVPFIGSQAIGHGAFVMMGDSDVLSDLSGDGYLTADNGVLANNLCGGSTANSRAWPEASYGYSFQNKGMSQFASTAKVAPSDILRPADLSKVFADWNYNPIISGALGELIQEELEMLTGLGPLGRLWTSMNGGTCFGLALSGGRFDDGAEELYSPPNGRTAPTWNVGSGPSASMLLPEPGDEESSPGYNEQFLRLDADDFVTQFSTEVLSSLQAQRNAYAVPITGVQALRSQLENVMDEGVDLHGGLTGSPDTGLAMITLQVSDGQQYGHEVLAYSLDVLPGEILKIGVWDNNFPGRPYYILVYPDGTWSYLDAPYPVNGGGYRYFGATYSLRGASGFNPGYVTVLPLYTPSGLHFYSYSGTSIADVGPGTTVASAVSSDGTSPSTQLTISGGLGYAGESLVYDSAAGEMSLEGAEPNADVRGSEDFMSVNASGPVHVTDDTAAGSLETLGAPAALSVARHDLRVKTTGASKLTLADNGALQAVAGNTGETQITLEFEHEGTIAVATLHSGATSPGQQLQYSAEEIDAIAGLSYEGEHKGSGGGGNSGSSGNGSGSSSSNSSSGQVGVDGISTSRARAAALSGHPSARRGVISVPVSCSSGSSSCAPLTIRLFVIEHVRRGHVVGVVSKLVSRTVLVGHAIVTLAAGDRRFVHIALNTLGRTLLARYSKLAITIDLSSGGQAIASRGLTVTAGPRVIR
jgi:hypothetical protein